MRLAWKSMGDDRCACSGAIISLVGIEFTSVRCKEGKNAERGTDKTTRGLLSGILAHISCSLCAFNPLYCFDAVSHREYVNPAPSAHGETIFHFGGNVRRLELHWCARSTCSHKHRTLYPQTHFRIFDPGRSGRREANSLELAIARSTYHHILCLVQSLVASLSITV